MWIIQIAKVTENVYFAASDSQFVFTDAMVAAVVSHRVRHRQIEQHLNLENFKMNQIKQVLLAFFYANVQARACLVVYILSLAQVHIHTQKKTVWQVGFMRNS